MKFVDHQICFLVECALEGLEDRSAEERIVLYEGVAKIHPDPKISRKALECARAIREAECSQIQFLKDCESGVRNGG